MNTDWNISVCYIQLFSIGFLLLCATFLVHLHKFDGQPNVLIAQFGFTDFTVK